MNVQQIENVLRSLASKSFVLFKHIPPAKDNARNPVKASHTFFFGRYRLVASPRQQGWVVHLSEIKNGENIVPEVRDAYRHHAIMVGASPEAAIVYLQQNYKLRPATAVLQSVR